jgi:type IV pilus assembly protein PilM
LSSSTAFRQGIYKNELVRRITRWLDATPHPPLALEITPERVAAARFGRTGVLDGYAVEKLPQGAIVPSAVESNIGNPAQVKMAVSNACARLKGKDEDIALILPDPVIRVFVQHFDEFPRSIQEAEPMLRWKLKKSVPFEVDETLISFMRQSPREDGVDIVTALARLRIVREYEALAEAVELRPGVVLSSSLAAITLLDDHKPTLLARVSENSLTTAIVREGVLCGYRCTELPAQGLELTPQMLLEEIYPVAAYYQDTWREGVQAVTLTGLGSRLPEFVPPFEEEFHCEISSLLHSAVSGGRVHDDVRPLVERELEGLVGWAMHRG